MTLASQWQKLLTGLTNQWLADTKFHVQWQSKISSQFNAHSLVCWLNNLSSCITLPNIHPTSSVTPSTLQSMWPANNSSKSFSTDDKHSFAKRLSAELSWYTDLSRLIHNSSKRNAWYLNFADVHSCLITGSSCNRNHAELLPSSALGSLADWQLAAWLLLNPELCKSINSSLPAAVKASVWLSAWDRMPWSKQRCENDSVEPTRQTKKSAKHTQYKTTETQSANTNTLGSWHLLTEENVVWIVNSCSNNTTVLGKLDCTCLQKLSSQINRDNSTFSISHKPKTNKYNSEFDDKWVNLYCLKTSIPWAVRLSCLESDIHPTFFSGRFWLRK